MGDVNQYAEANAIYETGFLGFSYGFRPGRSQHQALEALYTGLLTRKVNWVLDLMRSFFDGLSHEWLVKFIAHRIPSTASLRGSKPLTALTCGILKPGKTGKFSVDDDTLWRARSLGNNATLSIEDFSSFVASTTGTNQFPGGICTR